MRAAPLCFAGLAALALAALPWRTACAADDPTPQALELFEKHVRPLLVERCQKCHGAEKQKGGLRLDSAAGLAKGGESGPVVVAGKPEASALIEAVLYAEDPKMPPDGKLPAEAIAQLTEWVRLGAPWPAVDTAAADAAHPSHAAADWHQHWAFQPVAAPPLPELSAAAAAEGWVQSPVDRFVLARLEQAGLKPSPAVERSTLIRRLTFDLIGLPPQPDEVAAFVADDSPDAYSRLVDRLLASPHYGERWGRHWLDVARYADTKGYVFKEDRRLPYAYTYRDWVIRALNEDLPYNQFIVQQLAADCLPQGEHKQPLAALGFLTLGRRFGNSENDIIDDRIDVVSRGFLGLTVGCARCHDHKYDPIPTADYYSLWGVFASSEEKIMPIEPSTAEFDAELAKREHEIDKYLEEQASELMPRFRNQTSDYLLACYERRQNPQAKDYKLVEHPSEISGQLLGRWRNYLQQANKGFHPVFGPWFALTKLPAEGFDVAARQLADQYAAQVEEPQRVNRLVAAALAEQPPANIQEAAGLYARLFQQVDQDWRSAAEAAQKAQEPPPAALADPAAEELRQVFYGPKAPTNITATEMRGLLNQGQVEHKAKLEQAIIELRASESAPASAMGLADTAVPRKARVLLRGSSRSPGPEVPRQFLGCLAGEARKPFSQGSGRLELAQAITDANNPLTARVLVNRVWQHHFGSGLVRTPSDFGTRSDPPTHPELLDYLAARFMESGWSMKWLHRQILLSSTYRQASADRPDARRIDAENRLLWRMNRQRLDWEALRDALLAAAGTLDLTLGGRSVDVVERPFSHRRTIYGAIDRQNLPGLFRAFDFANPDTHSPQRFTTIVPQQALFLFNSGFAVEQACGLAARPDVGSITNTDRRIRRMYYLVFGREPSEEELELGRQYLSTPPQPGEAPGKLDPWQRYAQALLLTNEFFYID